MNNKIITSHQFFTFSALSTLGGSILVISSTIAGVAKQDAWISSLLTMASGFVMMQLYCYLGTRYDGLTFIGLSDKLFGRWLGKLVSLGYLLLILVTTYGIPHYIINFGTETMHETPAQIIALPFVVALVVAVYYGIECFSRASEVFFIFFTVLFIASILLVIPNAKYILYYACIGKRRCPCYQRSDCAVSLHIRTKRHASDDLSDQSQR